MPGYTFKQYDSRWGRKNYNGSSTMAAAGCGPTSCACNIYAINKKITPWVTAKFMKKHGYAVYNNGTAWSGIPACLKNFKMQDVHEQSTMAKALKKMKDGYLTVLLFRGGTKGGVTWTLGGHYLAATGYKEKNGKHYLYMRDPGGRDHDGWYCYEDKMKGLIVAVWTCTFDKNAKEIKKDKSLYTGTFPSTTVAKHTGTSANVKKWQKFLAWWDENEYFDIDGEFGDDTKSLTIKFQKKYKLESDGVVGPKTIEKAKQIAEKEKH